MTTRASLRRRDRDDAYVLSGELGLETVTGLLGDAESLFDSGGSVAVDLSEVTRVDSAGLALLLEWLERTRARGQALRLEHPPEQLLAIARVSGLDTILPFEPAPPAGEQ